MVSTFKSIGKGLLYVAIFPLGLVAIALYAVFGLFIFLYQFVRLIILFFTGRNLKTDLPEDIEARKILEGNKEENKDLSLYPSDTIVYDSGYSTPVLNEGKKEESVEEPKHFDGPKDLDEEEKEKEEENDEYFDHLV